MPETGSLSLTDITATLSRFTSTTPSRSDSSQIRIGSLRDVVIPHGSGPRDMLLKAINTMIPKSRGGQTCFGCAMGGVSGWLMMKVGKTAAASVGAALLLLQIAHYNGYVEVDWEALNRDLAARGHEFIRRSQFQEVSSPSLSAFLERNKNIAMGFVAGFLLGIAFS